MGHLLDDSVAVNDIQLEPVWIDYAFLEENQETEGRSLPIWVPPVADAAYAGRVSGERAVQKGLRNRPTRETARDTISWWKTLPAERTDTLRAGLSAEREAELLQLWASRNG
jgi:2'-hydroxyisoflavone reductase